MSNIDLWIEKYRPKKLDDLCISEETRKIITGFGMNVPNLLFFGVQGSGKTTLARIIVQDILKCDYLYINASDETGIDTIRNKVSGFSKTKSLDGNLKVVVLDESDFLSPSSQAALRNLIEENLDTTRFILTGNYKHKISPPLQSRCQSIDIKPSLKDCVLRCLDILKNEGIETTNDDKKQVVTLVKKHFPDLRKCINELQKYCGSGSIDIPDVVNTNDIVNLIWTNLYKKKGIQTRKYLIENGSSFNFEWDQLMMDLLNFIYEQDNMDDSVKKSMIIIIADHLEKSTRVIDKEINFFSCILNLEEVI